MDYEQRKPNFDCVLFDLDDTLYPWSSGIAAEISKNIQDYMVEKLGIERSKAPTMSKLLYQQYGTTLAGLRAVGFNFDHDDFHSYVHGKLPYDEMLKPDLVLRQLLHSLPIRKLVFTNGDELHAARALRRLGLEDCFEDVICFETLNPADAKESSPPAASNNRESLLGRVFGFLELLSEPGAADSELLPKSPILCKPSLAAMEHAFKCASIDPHKTVFFDDSVRNIKAGKLLGLHTVLVGTSHRVQGADHVLESIHNIREALPELWDDDEERADVRTPSGEVAVETTVTA